MLSVYNQENIVDAQQSVAARKPLNQTSGLSTKTPFRGRQDENQIVQGGKKTATFVTPAPKTVRTVLGAKTTNAKAAGHAVQTPAAKLPQTQQPTNRISSTRPAIKKKIFVAPEEDLLQLKAQEDDEEPEVQYCPPPIVPLPDLPLELLDEEHITYADDDYGVGIEYFQSSKDEHGASLSLKMEEEARKESLERDLAKMDLTNPGIEDPDSQVIAMIAAGPKQTLSQSRAVNRASVRQPATITSQAAVNALSQQKSVRTHQRLPSAATRETVASMSKRKHIPSFSVASDEPFSTSSYAMPSAKSTIGFPKARKAPSIIPRSAKSNDTPAKHQISSAEAHEIAANISPHKFVQLYGEPPVDSEMWLRLLQLEINDRHREDDNHESADIFDFDEEDASYDGFGMDDDDDFQLPLE